MLTLRKYKRAKKKYFKDIVLYVSFMDEYGSFFSIRDQTILKNISNDSHPLIQSLLKYVSTLDNELDALRIWIKLYKLHSQDNNKVFLCVRKKGKFNFYK